jgi:hypothetical protein
MRRILISVYCMGIFFALADQGRSMPLLKGQSFLDMGLDRIHTADQRLSESYETDFSAMGHL